MEGAGFGALFFAQKDGRVKKVKGKKIGNISASDAVIFVRRERDSNPRYPLEVRQFSKLLV